MDKIAEALPRIRNRLEKNRDLPQRAEECRTELQRNRDKLLETIAEVRLALLELEEYALAAEFSKLHEALLKFNLLTPDHSKLCAALNSYAARLPVNNTVSAAVIGRLMNNVRLGHYPTDPENISYILKGISFPAGIISNVFDPCCGAGKALRQLAQGNNCFTYGVELDEGRAEEAQTRLHRVGFGSFFRARISHEAFHLMLLNPPYLSVLNESGSRSRHEKRFLIESLCYLMYGGLLIYIIPYYRLTPDICRILCDNYAELSVYRVTDSEFKKFKQIVVLGLRKKRGDGSQQAVEMSALALRPNAIPCITQISAGRYALPAISKQVELFKGERFNVAELAQQLRRSDSFSKLLAQSELDQAVKRPPLPLSIGQVGLIGGSGMINGLVDCEYPHIIKGRIVKQKRVSSQNLYDADGDYSGREIKETISNKMIFNILTPQGFKSLT